MAAFFLNYIVAEVDAFIADKYRRSRDNFPNRILRLAAEGTANLKLLPTLPLWLDSRIGVGVGRLLIRPPF
jgi:hypothetical protein